MCQRLSRPRCSLSKHCTPSRVSQGSGFGRALLRVIRPRRPLCSSHSQLLALRRSHIAVTQLDRYRLPHLHRHQAEEPSRSSRTLVLIGAAAACAVLTLFSARGLRAAGRTPCRLLVGRANSGCSRALQRVRASLSASAQNPRVPGSRVRQSSPIAGLSASREGSGILRLVGATHMSRTPTLRAS